MIRKLISNKLVFETRSSSAQFSVCDDIESNPDFIACENESQKRFLICINDCNHDDFFCFSNCNREYDENVADCPCQDWRCKISLHLYASIREFSPLYKKIVQMDAPAQITHAHPKPKKF